MTEAGDEWSLARLRPYADHLIAAFGTRRLMFGSDWPVVELAAPFEQWWAAANELAAGLGSDDRDALFGATAARFYRL